MTSVGGSGGSTGLTLTGGPIVASGTLTLGGTLGTANGGLNLTGYTTGDLLYASSSTVIARRAIGSTGDVLTVTGGVPVWAPPVSTGTVTSVAGSGGSTGLTLTGGPITSTGTLTLGGTLGVANGGTGAATLTAHGVMLGNGASAVNLTSVGTTNTVLHGNTSADPTFSAVSLSGDVTGTLPIANGGTNGTTRAAAFNNLVPDSTGKSGDYLQVLAGGGYDWIANNGVTSFSAGVTGLTPSTATTGAVTLAGTLNSGHGGTGLTTYTTGDMIYWDGFNLTKLAIGGANTLIHGGTVPAYSAVDLTADVTGVLTKTNGGTGLSSYSTGDILYANGSGNLTRLAIGSYGGVLVNSTTGLPAWVAPGTSGYVLTSHGISSDADWQPASTGTVTSVSGTTNRITVATGTTTPVIDISSSYVGQSSITTLGTIATGVWNGTGVGVAYGGTGVALLTAHGVLVGNGTSGVNVTSVGATNTVLHGNTGADPTYSAVALGSDVSGTLPIANGGTAGTTAAAALKNIVPDTTGNTGKFLSVAAGGGINWQSASGGSGTVTSVSGSGGSTGLTLTGGPITTSGTLTLGGTLAVANGGAGQSSYTDGQLLIGNSSGNTLTKATLTGGSGISISNGNGSITVTATGGSSVGIGSSLYGDGSDGVAAFDGSTTVAGAT